MKNLARRKRSTKKQRRKRRRHRLIFLLVIIFFILGYLAGSDNYEFSDFKGKLNTGLSQIEKLFNRFKPSDSLPEKKRADGKERSEIHLFDLGEGSSILLLAKDGSNLLIDTGKEDDSEKRIIGYLDEEIALGGAIDLLIFSNNNSNHIGHSDLVVDYFDVKEVWMNGLDTNTKVYSNLLDNLLESKTEYLEPKAGDQYSRNAFEIEILNPDEQNNGENQKDESIVARIEFDNLSLMFTGDLSAAGEKDIMDKNPNLKSDILILGDNGSNDSNREEWINSVDPSFAFYQAAEDNTKDHPGEKTIEKLENADIPVYGTDKSGMISILVDKEGKIDIKQSKK